MLRDDLRLLFETEKRLLRRRLAQFFPRPVSAERAFENRGVAPTQPRPRTTPPKPSTVVTTRARRQRRRKRALELSNWAVSILLHLVLASLILPHFRTTTPEAEGERSVEVRWFTKTPPRPETPTPDPDPPTIEPEPQVAEIEPESKAEEAPSDPKNTAEQEAPEIFGMAGGGTPGSASELGSRVGERARAARIARYGGSEATEAAVRDGLDWLVRHQEEDGSWDPERFTRHCAGNRCQGSGYPEFRVGVTALATLAFLAAGEDGHRESPHRSRVRSALGYLVSIQDALGCFGSREGNYMYNHAIATFCLAEAAALTKDRRYQETAIRGLLFSSNTQQPGGGWDYTSARTMRNDLSVTGWQAMAIHTALENGLSVDERMVNRLRGFLRRAVRRNGWATYADRGTGQGRGGVSMVAVGMLSKLYLGASTTAKDIVAAANILVRNPPDPDARSEWERTFQTSYYWYYATLALFHVGGDHWSAWNTYLERSVLPLQAKSGHERGSWDPDPNWVGSAGGRIATTAMCILMFEVYYRYTPLHERSENQSSGK
ncbi:MAG: terpene cyclase/mutase family protein [Planctomycetes bacterium]|nr:terpene cyclase/mutase family protein [Planctomycetota bacterium]